MDAVPLFLTLQYCQITTTTNPVVNPVNYINSQDFLKQISVNYQNTLTVDLHQYLEIIVSASSEIELMDFVILPFYVTFTTSWDSKFYNATATFLFQESHLNTK